MLSKFLSLPHWDNATNDGEQDFYLLLKNADKQFIDEIHDIYFGLSFEYTYKGQKKRLGNVMGQYVSDNQLNYLFKIQAELGIPISATFNDLNIPREFHLDREVSKQFISYIGGLYKRGLRSITISNKHLVKSGILQRNFPELRIKNTVNHRVDNAQSVLDHIYLGYDTILLDRNLNRNITELKKIKNLVDTYNHQVQPEKTVYTSLLVTESCMADCPFKREHDDYGDVTYFDTLSFLSCDNWRKNPVVANLPRAGLDTFFTDWQDFNTLMSLVDIIKFSGRNNGTSFSVKPNQKDEIKKMSWAFPDLGELKYNTLVFSKDKPRFFNSFKEARANNCPYPSFLVPSWVLSELSSNSSLKYINGVVESSIYRDVSKFKDLSETLFNCRSQCYACHKCEKVYGVSEFQSLIQL